MKKILLLLFTLCSLVTTAQTPHTDTYLKNRTDSLIRRITLTSKNVADNFQMGWDSKVSILAPRLGTSSISGYVWVSTDNAGHGSWQDKGVPSIAANKFVIGIGTGIAASNFSVNANGLVILNNNAPTIVDPGNTINSTYVLSERTTLTASGGGTITDALVVGDFHHIGDGANFYSGTAGFTYGVNNNNFAGAGLIGGAGAQLDYGGNGPSSGGISVSLDGNGDRNDLTWKYVRAVGGAVNISHNTTSQTSGHGAMAAQSFILGTENGHIPSTSPRAMLLSGQGMSARPSDPDQVYVPNFNIYYTPGNDNALTQILVRDAATGQVKYRTSSSISGTPGGSNTQVQYNNSGVFAGNSGMTYNGSVLSVTTGINTASITSTSGLSIIAGTTSTYTSTGLMSFATTASSTSTASSNITIGTGNNTGSGASGTVTIQTGTTVSGTRGSMTFNSGNLTFNSTAISHNSSGTMTLNGGTGVSISSTANDISLNSARSISITAAGSGGLSLSANGTGQSVLITGDNGALIADAAFANSFSISPTSANLTLTGDLVETVNGTVNSIYSNINYTDPDGTHIWSWGAGDGFTTFNPDQQGFNANTSIVFTAPSISLQGTINPNLNTGSVTNIVATNSSGELVITDRVGYSNITAATANSKLLGRRSASSGNWEEITLGTNLSMSGTTLNATGGGGLGGSTGSVDNAMLRADGTGGSTVQASTVIIDDTGNIVLGTSSTTGSSRAITSGGSSTDVSLELNPKGAGSLSTNLNGSTAEFSTHHFTANTSTPARHFRTIQSSTGTVANGFGTEWATTMQNASGSTQHATALTHTWIDATNGSEDAKLALNVAVNSVLTEVINFTGTSIAAAIPYKLKNYTVSTLPSSPQQGMVCFVTDALTPSFLVTVVGGGSAVTPVFYNGANWVAY